MTHQDAERRLTRCRLLIGRAQVACREGDLDRALELFGAALSAVPLHRYLDLPNAREPLKTQIAEAFAIFARGWPLDAGVTLSRR